MMKNEQDKKREQEECMPKVNKAALEASKKLKEKQLTNNETVKKDGKDCNS